MLRTRLLTAIVLIPLVVLFIYLGDLSFLALVAVLATLAEVEFCLLTARHRFRPVQVFGIALVWLILLDGEFPEWKVLRAGLVVILAVSLIWQVLRHRQSDARDWGIVIASALYVGLYSSYLIRLREIPEDGLWWTLIAVPAILVADSAAYFIGSAWGRHKLAPALSSGKTWEGYVGGIFVAGLAGGFFGWLWSFAAGPASVVTGAHGLRLGVLVGTLGPAGDLVISMVKREAGADDSSGLLPGHGGALDRLDSVLWTAVLAYYYVAWFVT